MDWTAFWQFLLRWLHLLAGITWIGMLYFFNLVNVNFMKALDAPTKGKVVPQLMPRALFWFRWGAVVTWLTGFFYFVWIVLAEQTARSQQGLPGSHAGLALWLVVWLAAWGIIYALLQPLSGALNKGIVLGVIVAVLVLAASVGLWKLSGPGLATSRSISIGIGGGIGTLMLLNVWGIIWPHQKRIIAWTKENAEKGTPVPPESAKLARRAFLTSRMNTWLSIVMLWFMAMASHWALFSAR
jgi:uncharacterized membrane protein